MDALSAFYIYVIIVLAIYAIFTLDVFREWDNAQRITVGLFFGAIFILFVTPYVSTPTPATRFGFTILILLAYITVIVMIFYLVRIGKFTTMFRSECKEIVTQEKDKRGRMKVVRREMVCKGGLSPPSSPMPDKYKYAASF